VSDRFKGWDVEALRNVLRARAATLHRDRRVKVRFDESDLVNETFLKAARTESFPNDLDSPAKQLAWLMAVQGNLLCDMLDHEHTAKKDVRREQDEEGLRQALHDSSVAHGAMLPAQGPRPDEVAERQELLQAALSAMTEDEQQIVKLKMENRTFDEIAQLTGRGGPEVARIYYAALKKAKQKMEGRPDGKPGD
jgi:RNA polymerase sigma factor (sigma-70 family)